MTIVTNLGFPRIGARRELKQALERYWRGDTDATLRWTERGGPTVTAPDVAHGFGSQLIELSAVRQLGGTVTRDWQAEGLVMTITVPLAAFRRD